MAVKRLTMPTTDEQQRIIRNRTREGNRVEMPTGQKFADVVLWLAPAVTEADFPALGAAIKAIPGIQNVTLMVHGEADDTIPENTKLMLCTELMLRIDNLPETPPEAP